jgi:hypothetical protein
MILDRLALLRVVKEPPEMPPALTTQRVKVLRGTRQEVHSAAKARVKAQVRVPVRAQVRVSSRHPLQGGREMPDRFRVPQDSRLGALRRVARVLPEAQAARRRAQFPPTRAAEETAVGGRIFPPVPHRCRR